MDDEDNDYELERQKTIAENQELLNSLGLDPNGSAKLNIPKPAKSVIKHVASKKRKSTASIVDEGPRRRSGRIAGLEADGEALKAKVEEEEKEREVLRVVARKERGQVMDIKDLLDESDDKEKKELNDYLTGVADLKCSRRYPEESTSANEAYADLEKDKEADEVTRLSDQFKDMELRGNAKVTNDRVFSMAVHPDKTKDLVFVGDKYGSLGIWDALGPATEKLEDEDDTSGVKTEDDEEQTEGRIWRLQAHARNSITAMKVDPVNGSGLFSSSYDCTLRHLDFSTLKSTELFAHSNDDMLITHFDLMPTGQQAWLADKNGGISFCDFREGQQERKRWVVQEEGRAAKLGGLSVNPLQPHLLVTAGNDQHLRIWDTRHFSRLNPRSTELMTPPPSSPGEDTKPRLNTYPTSSIENEKISNYQSSTKGKGLLRASYQHGKSCSAAYWDPWGRRILTTSYDDTLRIWSLNPDSFAQDAPLPSTHFQPSKKVPHNCQTGRWLTILRAQWSANMDFMPHFTVGNMKRTLDVRACNGEKIVGLWADPVTAVPAVTTSHPGRVDHVFGGNTSGRIQFWASGSSS